MSSVGCGTVSLTDAHGRRQGLSVSCRRWQQTVGVIARCVLGLDLADALELHRSPVPAGLASRFAATWQVTMTAFCGTGPGSTSTLPSSNTMSGS